MKQHEALNIALAKSIKDGKPCDLTKTGANIRTIERAVARAREEGNVIVKYDGTYYPLGKAKSDAARQKLLRAKGWKVSDSGKVIRVVEF